MTTPRRRQARRAAVGKHLELLSYDLAAITGAAVDVYCPEHHDAPAVPGLDGTVPAAPK